ncbi:MAG: penicillin-binding protein activator [Pseudomonadota bacterium]
MIKPTVLPRLALGICLCAIVIVSGCSGSSTRPVAAPNPLSLGDIDAEIIKARQLLDAQQQGQRLVELAGQLQQWQEGARALSLIDTVRPDDLDDSAFVDYTLIASTLYIESQSIFRALDLLSTERLKAIWPQLSPEQQIPLYKNRADSYSQIGDAQSSIRERIALSAQLSDPLDNIENNEALWQELLKLSSEQLRLLEQNSDSEIAKGWYQLANIDKRNENLDAKQVAVAQWIRDNPSHPASLELPLDLQLLKALIQERPTKVALLLPMQGRLSTAGKAIRDGFFAAYYTQQSEFKPEVVLYDTSAEDIDLIYDQAMAAGAKLVIGPLEKDSVAQLQQRESLPVTTLALNYSQDTGVTSIGRGFYQFGLSLEDEAIQAADRAWLEGHRYAMVLASDADWSSRAASAFVNRWQENGGIVVVDRIFTRGSSFSAAIESALAINESKSRARQLKRLFGRNFEFEPRRRQDIDMIFLVARASEGQQIKPTLAFHYAGNIPVYATSQIYSSAQTPSKNRDLNGIRFTTLPWILDEDGAEKQLIAQQLKTSDNYERLYAMGVDSFLLHDRLKQLASSANTSIYGTTGKLRLDSEKRIVREQPWAQIVKGRAERLPYLTHKTESE